MSEIKVFELNNGIIDLQVLNIGAVIYKLYYKNVNRVLSYSNLDDYKTNPIALGAIVGRVAGRISNAKFELNGKTYNLDNNEKNYSIHGGNKSLIRQYFDVEEINEDAQNPYITLKTKLNDGDAGYPGNVDIAIKYTLIENTVKLEIFAKSDQDTLVNITNHSYFNFNKDKNESIKNHDLMIKSDNFIKSDDKCIPLSLEDSQNTDFDLNEFKSLNILDNLNDTQTKMFGGYDHTFVLNDNKPQIRFKNEEVQMDITTSYPAVVVYSGNAIGENFEFENAKSFNHQGICFEAQYEPDFINQDFLEDHILKKDEEYYHTIEYKFI